MCAGEVSAGRLALCGRCHAGQSPPDCQNIEEDVFTVHEMTFFSLAQGTSLSKLILQTCQNK